MASPGLTITEQLAKAADSEAFLAGTKARRLVAITYREAAGAGAEFKLLHGAAVSGGVQIFAAVLAANASGSAFFGQNGVSIPNGLTLDRVSGTIDVISFWYDEPGVVA